MVEGWLEGEASVGGFEAVDGAEGCWDADAASAITSESDWDETCANCVRAAAGGAAGIVLRVIWIWRRSFERVVARSVWGCQLEVNERGPRDVPKPNSCIWSFPTTTAPASSSFFTHQLVMEAPSFGLPV